MKFSILTAGYNNNCFLEEYLSGVLDQTYPRLEIIFVDDASTDETWKTVSAVKDRRFIAIRNQERLFCSSAYDVALRRASGDICGVVDADDVLVPGAVSKICSFYRKYPNIDYIYTQHWWCNRSMKKLRKGLSSIPAGGSSFAKLAMKKVHGFSHWRTFRRSMAKKATLFPKGLKYAVDKNLGFVLQSIGQGGFVNIPLYRYRYYKGNMSLVFAEEQKKTWMALASEYVNKKYYQIRPLK